MGSIVYELGESDIMAIFQAFGKILSCQLIPNPETGKHKGYGFVEFETEDAAKGAIQCMNGFSLGGRQLKVQYLVCICSVYLYCICAICVMFVLSQSDSTDGSSEGGSSRYLAHLK